MKRTLAVALSLVLALAFAPTAFAATTDGVPTVSVSASASMTVAPDIAYVSLGVQTVNKSSKTARQENTKLMTAVQTAIKNAGVADKDVQTSGLSMYANYSYDNNGNRKFTGYTVTNTLTITVRDLDKLGDIVDAAVNAGANQFNSVTFDLEDEEEYYTKVLSEATKKAQKRATAMATASGMTLGSVVSLSASDSDYSPYRYYPTVSAVAETAADEASIGSTISTGSVTVSASVSAVYSMK